MHKIYDIMFEGFTEILNDIPPDYDKHTDGFIGMAYEVGRHLAIVMLEKGENVNEVTVQNIFSYKSRYRKEL